MPLAAILGLATAVVQLGKILAERLLPEKQCPTFRKGAKKSIDFSGKTIEDIRAVGVKKGWIKGRGHE